MANRNMQVKVAKARNEAGEYATQAYFKEATAQRGAIQVLNGKAIPRPEPKQLDDMVAEYRAKQSARHAQRAAEVTAQRHGTYRTGLRDVLNARHF